MSDRQSKEEIWDQWVRRTILPDIHSTATPDPVPMVDDSDSELSMTEEYDSYRLGRGSGDYLYLLYLLDEPADGPSDVIPVYIGETSNVASRLMNHFRKLRDALPISEWEDDGSWGSYGKYDHIATVYEKSASQLYAWVVNVDDLEVGPYGYSTYRHELEGKMVGLVHSIPRFDRVFANRDFVPNRVPHEMGKVGPDWVDGDNMPSNEEAQRLVDSSVDTVSAETKSDLWHDWVEDTICRDIDDSDEADPIPLFETDGDLTVETKTAGSSTVLKRSDAIDERIRREGTQCVHSDGVRDGESGLLYVLYQIPSNTEQPSPSDIVPRYIGKAEAYGKKNELSANFEEIAKDRGATRSFARWGDGSYWHVGELSETVFGETSKKLSWASELFEEGTRRLEEQTYLWIRAWDPDTYPGPYGYPVYLAEVEPLLVGLAYEAYPEQLLNHNEVPDHAPANSRDFEFQPAKIHSAETLDRV
ncbi:GIY-YIG nuclease family protein [Halomicrobium salinisoli]|uniref:GIY-YIG nuclease family protein n=1 Tax=Halomicrobium salinisoli TaxID=2878391 RepID=UPI001CF0687E|nr:GIY-YIG nuclease family protein [Halomicrobium salinisoli]